jgi:hypothetical protein
VHRHSVLMAMVVCRANGYDWFFFFCYSCARGVHCSVPLIDHPQSYSRLLWVFNKDLF